MPEHASDSRNERDLLASARSGDQTAFEALVGRHREGLERFFYLMLGDRRGAALLVEGTVLRAWIECESADSAVPVKIWLYRIAIRECRCERGAASEGDSPRNGQRARRA
jgi:DNA-directed RNA polymerase specialized sigma24 family protein